MHLCLPVKVVPVRNCLNRKYNANAGIGLRPRKCKNLLRFAGRYGAMDGPFPRVSGDQTIPTYPISLRMNTGDIYSLLRHASSCFHWHENKKLWALPIYQIERKKAYASKLATPFYDRSGACLNWRWGLLSSVDDSLQSCLIHTISGINGNLACEQLLFCILNMVHLF